MNMNNIKCQIRNHEEKPIISVCLDKDCQHNRLCCYFCVGKVHNNHFDKLIEIEKFNSFIQQESQKQGQQNTFGQDQVIQNLEQLSKQVDSFHKIIKAKLEIIKKQNFQEEIKSFGHIQQGSEHWNKILEGILQYVEVNNGQITHKKQNELNKIEEKSIQIIKQLEQNLQQMMQQFNLLKQQKQLKFQQNPILLQNQYMNSVTLSQDGSLIVSGSYDYTIKIWDVKSQSLQNTICNDCSSQIVAISSNNEYLAFDDCIDNAIILFDIKQNKLRCTYNNIGIISNIIFSQDTQYVLFGGDNLAIWSVNNNNQIHSFLTDSCIEAIIMSRDNKLVSCICQNGTIFVWDFQTKLKLIEHQNTHEIGFDLCSSSDSSIFISSGNDGVIKIWQFDQIQGKQNKLAFINKIKVSNNSIQKVLLTSDDVYIISICNEDGKIMVYERVTGRLIQVLDSGETFNKVASISISNDMNTLVSYNRGDFIKIWRTVEL